MAHGDLTIIGDALSRILSHRPLAAGSLIVTLYGDCIVPRGGVLGVGPLTRLLEPFRINGGQVRTALSRLAADGWFERRRDGRTSSYALAADRAADFRQAARRIYAAREVPEVLVFDQAVLVEPDAARRQALKSSLIVQGFGQIAPTVFVRPRHDLQPTVVPPVPGVVWGSLILDCPEADGLVSLIASAWPLDAIGRAYEELVDDLSALARRPPVAPEAAFVTRLLLIHQYRRIVLKDPLLPRFMLPEGWPGHRARDLAATLYRAVLPASEVWLTTVSAEHGDALPEAGDTLAQRFS
jgi:phenylacetic acid degradation operon negative regulatory protein